MWYGWSVSLVALLAYLGAVGWFISTEGGAFVETVLTIDTAAPVPALLASSPLSLPTLATLQTAAASSPTTLIFPAASVVLALALVGTVAKFGHSWATWLYALAAIAPLALVAAGSVGMVRPLAVDIVALGVLPLLGAGGFVVDAGRYLWAAR
ncbi:molecular chaperone DnaJ [Haloferax sp. DFSO60]|uniref:molecular chaperone DnaJ n=1 Tax=Haloferax sp. DFSO60 TaxID=3388652 RepID=UPI00397C3997